ncbi:MULTISPECIES: hypothetical protein [Cyanophyceae]|uniref:hypothetical protein n=1 Tax=Cyanophyceae TaxID=3028117 RepID=UPI0011813CDB|nr:MULTISPECIES: hypothetical protein [Cyanophyceae]
MDKAWADLMPTDGLTRYEDYRQELITVGWIPSPDPILNRDVDGMPEVICGTKICSASFISADKKQGISIVLWPAYLQSYNQRALYVAPQFEIYDCSVESMSVENFYCE